MLIRSIRNAPGDTEVMEARLQGAGGVSICLFNREGQLLLTSRLHVGGAQQVGGRTILPLSLKTGEQRHALVPLLACQTNAHQLVRFMGREHDEVTAERARSVGLDTSLLAELKGAREVLEKAFWRRRPAPSL